MGSFFKEVGGGEIDRDALGRERGPMAVRRRPHTLPTSHPGLIRQPHQRESRHAAGDLHLGIHRPDIDALKRNGTNACDHAGLPDLRLLG